MNGRGGGPTPKGLAQVETFYIPEHILRSTLSTLVEAGHEGAEAFVLWGGQLIEGSAFRFTSMVVPDQQPLVTGEGLLVIVPGEALFKVNKRLHERGEILGGQVHSHPRHAYHSDTDDHFPLVTLVGALSIVVPNFARNAPADLDDWAWYRLSGYGRWTPVGPETEVVFEHGAT